eukprot:s2432_g6.t1
MKTYRTLAAVQQTQSGPEREEVQSRFNSTGRQTCNDILASSCSGRAEFFEPKPRGGGASIQEEKRLLRRQMDRVLEENRQKHADQLRLVRLETKLEKEDLQKAHDLEKYKLESAGEVFPYIFEEPLGTFHDLEAGETYFVFVEEDEQPG